MTNFSAILECSMKSRLLIFSISFLILNALGARLPFELREERRIVAQEIVPLNIKRDSIDELLVIWVNHMSLSDQKGRFFWDFHFGAAQPKSVTVIDFNQDGLKEIFLNYSEGLTQIIDCYRPTLPGDVIKRFVLNHKGNLVWNKKIDDLFSSPIFSVADIESPKGYIEMQGKEGIGSTVFINLPVV